jgi:hypothetical protein
VILLSLALVVASAGTLVGGLATSSAPLVWASLAAGIAAVALVAGSVTLRRTRLTEATPAAPVAHEAGEGSPRTPAGSGPPIDLPNAGGVFPGDRPPPPPPLPADTPPVVPIAQSDRSEAGGTVVSPGTPDAPFGDTPSGSDTPEPRIAPTGAAVSSQSEGRTAELSEPSAEPLGGPGEPPVEDVPIADALRVAQLSEPVTVRDGHPRYHLADCPTLSGTGDAGELPVSVARRSGFTPCAVCAPDRTLLARSRHGRG